MKNNISKKMMGDFTDVIKNKVVLLVDEIENSDELYRYAEKDMIELLEVVSFEDQASLIPVGGKIVDTNSIPCTAAFHGKKGTADVTVTAGHCNQGSATGPWYYPSKSTSNNMGNFTARTSGNTTSDSGYITLNSSSWKGTTERINGGKVSAVDWGGVDTVNDWLYISGGMQSTLLLGQVRNGSANIDFSAFTSGGYNTISNLTLTNISGTVNGDSGAPVLEAYYNNNQSQWKLTGIHKGLVTLSDGVTYEVFSKVTEAYDDLSLSAITINTGL